MALYKRPQMLGLSPREEKVIFLLQKGRYTPLEIARETKISRPTIYDILEKLKKRGLVNSSIKDGKKLWSVVSRNEIAELLYDTKKILLRFSDGSEELHGTSDSMVIVHRGKEAVHKIVFEMIRERKNERFLCLAAFNESMNKGWLDVFTPEEMDEFNRVIKKNRIISELVAPAGWIDEHFKALGESWAKNYEGRTASSVYIDKEYFQHSGQIFAFREVLYLLALKDQIVIEIRHSDIQKMILGMYAFMKDNGKSIDVNRMLRELVGNEQ